MLQEEIRQNKRLSRLNRALSQRLYLIQIENKISSEGLLQFYILGSTGNVYNVVVNKVYMSCDCPDCKIRKNICKHMYFLVHRVLKYDQNVLIENLIHTDLRKEFIEIIKNQNISQSIVASKSIKDKLNYHLNPISSIKQRDLEGEVCAICFEEFSSFDIKDKDNQLMYCWKSCGNSCHKECFTRWSKYNKKEQCVYCKVELKEESSYNEYLNLQ